jgi:hypothetical protein
MTATSTKGEPIRRVAPERMVPMTEALQYTRTVNTTALSAAASETI